MKNKWFLKGCMLGFALMVITVLSSSVSFGYYSPLTQNFSLDFGSLFSNYTFDSSLSLGLGFQTSNYAETFMNPYVQTSNTGSYYSDMFSTASQQNSTYQNILGFGLDSGSYMYANPTFSAGGEHLYASQPGASFGTQHDYTRSMFGSTDYYGSSMDIPWTHYSSELSTASSPFGQSYVGASLNYGKPTMFSGYNRDVEGILNLVTYGPGLMEMGRAMGDQKMYTSDGMAFYGNPFYFNPYSSSNWYFGSGATVQAGVTP
jgi:hypothetical protein